MLIKASVHRNDQNENLDMELFMRLYIFNPLLSEHTNTCTFNVSPALSVDRLIISTFH